MSSPIRRQLFIETFADHEGLEAIRYGVREGSQPFPPADWTKSKYFCFQVYVTFKLSLDQFSESACAKLADHLIDLEDMNAAQPVWEFYTGYKTPLECVNHSRREIAFRKPPQPPIRKIHVNDESSQKLAFLFIVDKEENWDKPVSNTKWPDETGPLWVYFDPRIPSTVTNIDRQWLVDDLGTEWPDQVEMTVKRPQYEDTHNDFSSAYRMTAPEFDDDEDEDEEDEDHDVEEGVDAVAESRLLIQQLPEPDLVLIQDAEETTTGITITRHDGITVTNSSHEPELKYVVSVLFDCQLEQIARIFAASVMELTNKTFHFDFYDRIRMGITDVGVLTDVYSPRAFWDPLDHTRPTRGATRRLFPIDHNPNVNRQDPITSGNPYGTFLVILDRPDFTTMPAVRLLLSDGRLQHYPHGDHNEAECWRCPDMQDVVDRLTLKHKQI